MQCKEKMSILRCFCFCDVFVSGSLFGGLLLPFLLTPLNLPFCGVFSFLFSSATKDSEYAAILK